MAKQTQETVQVPAKVVKAPMKSLDAAAIAGKAKELVSFEMKSGVLNGLRPADVRRILREAVRQTKVQDGLTKEQRAAARATKKADREAKRQARLASRLTRTQERAQKAQARAEKLAQQAKVAAEKAAKAATLVVQTKGGAKIVVKNPKAQA